VLKTVIFSLQMGPTYDFVPDCLYKLCFWQFKLFFLTIPNFVVFSGYRVGSLMRISKNCLKQSLSYSKSVLPAILSLIVLSNYVPGSSNFDTTFLPDCTKFCSVFLNYRIRNLMRILKMCLKQSFSHCKWVLHTILYLTVSTNCVFGSSNFSF